MRETKEPGRSAEEHKEQASRQIDSAMQDRAAATDRAFDDALEEWRTHHDAGWQTHHEAGPDAQGSPG